MTGRNGQSKGLGKDDPSPKNSSKNSRVQKPESSEGQRVTPRLLRLVPPSLVEQRQWVVGEARKENDTSA